jgi:hypothetical protein
MHVNLSGTDFIKTILGSRILLEIQAEITCGEMTLLFSMGVGGTHHCCGQGRVAGTCPEGFFLDT